MAFIQLSGISLTFTEAPILKDVDFRIGTGDKIALIGTNGSGKSTLMKIMKGQIEADSGDRITSKDLSISYLPQTGIQHQGARLYEEIESVYQPIRDLIAERDKKGEVLKEKSSESKETSSLLEDFHQLQEKITESDYYRREEKISAVLKGLGFDEEDHFRETDTFSGGWQMRIALAKVLVEGPEILLLDEPTNYLDIEARDWLKDYLNRFSGGLLIVSHDRSFLDSCIHEVAELFLGEIHRYKGNYSSYEEKRKGELEKRLAEYRRQQEEIKKTENFIAKFRYNAAKAAQVQSRIKSLEKMERIELPEHMKPIHFSIPKAPHSGKKILRIEKLSKQYGDKTVFSDLDLEIERGERLALVGVNGAGKSTLLRIIAGRESPSEGKIRYGSGVKTAFFSQDENDRLDGSQTVIEKLESEAPTELMPELRNMLGSFLFRGEDIYKPVKVLSGGEKSRICLLSLLLHPRNLLVLDEPTNHLDMVSKNILLNALSSTDSTIIFVAHDRYFIEKLADKVLELRDGSYRVFPGDYSYYRYKIEKEAAETDENRRLSRGMIEREKESRPSQDRINNERTKRRRNELQKLEREEESCMRQMEDLDERRAELETELTKKEVYTNGKRVREITTLLEKIEVEHDRLYKQWEEIEERQKVLVGERD